jgi:hypothetical protein
LISINRKASDFFVNRNRAGVDLNQGQANSWRHSDLGTWEGNRALRPTWGMTVVKPTHEWEATMSVTRVLCAVCSARSSGLCAAMHGEA